MIAVAVFGVLIMIHEVGHYTAARIFGVTIREFAIGMGPKIFTRVSGKTNIRYSLRLLPIGGFVNMVGEDEESDANDTGALNNKPVWNRLIISAAGAVLNIALGIVLMFVVVLLTKTIGSTTIVKFADEAAVTMQSGLRVGDEIVKIKNSNVHIANDLAYEVMRNGIEPIDVTVIRNGEKIVIPNVTFPTTVQQGLTFGTIDFYIAAVGKNPLTVIKHTYYQTLSSMKMIWQSLFDLLTGRYGIEQMSGPVGVTTAIGEAADSGSSNLLYLCAVITLNLGIFNLLPLPALDGGRIVFQLIELIRRKPIKPEYEGYVHFVGIVLLMILMVAVTYQDIVKLFK